MRTPIINHYLSLSNYTQFLQIKILLKLLDLMVILSAQTLNKSDNVKIEFLMFGFVMIPMGAMNSNGSCFE